MAESHLSNEQFFTRLTDLFGTQRNKNHGSIYLTQKRLTYDLDTSTDPVKVADDPEWDLHPPNPLPIIIRATNGKSKAHRADKAKLSTIVQPDQLEAFYTRYADVCKAGMIALKKRDRSKRKTKAKKKRATTDGEKKG
ncbi:signal recognition particle, SRP9/SRP14 subunit [Saccharata proteae CBS 121410]|uniref:Signal recognition particle subunit SRP14 n=1 Tax=Saccharata proteae CBS 121410 TaxID=1314787 RepID=A0A9P4HZ14_9PEZI|nr:signal recognition particle, SRP9/SRP14 subunit [Saccharata proteae CBS 121410]